jgi:hypothetical protein
MLATTFCAALYTAHVVTFMCVSERALPDCWTAELQASAHDTCTVRAGARCICPFPFPFPFPFPCLHFDMSEPRSSDRKRTPTDFLGATEAPRSQTKAEQDKARRAHEAAVANAYGPLVGLKQLGEAGGGAPRTAPRTA